QPAVERRDRGRRRADRTRHRYRTPESRPRRSGAARRAGIEGALDRLSGHADVRPIRSAVRGRGGAGRLAADSSRLAPLDSRLSTHVYRLSTRRVFTVTELSVEIRDSLEEKFGEIWVEGELSNCRLWNTGHLYFTLKDERAQLRGVIFRSALRYLRFKPGDGL